MPYARLRPLAQQFKTLEPQAKEATLSFVNLVGNEAPDYALDALDRFRDLCEVSQRFACPFCVCTELTLFPIGGPSTRRQH